MEKFNQNRIDFLREKISSLVLISKDKTILETLHSEKDIEFYLIDDLESLNGIGI